MSDYPTQYPTLAAPFTVQVSMWNGKAIELQLTQTEAGRYATHTPRRRGPRRTVTVGRYWDVHHDGKLVAQIRYIMITRETRSRGRTYVNSRWESPGWQVTTDRGRYWREEPSRSSCLTHIAAHVWRTL